MRIVFGCEYSVLSQECIYVYRCIQKWRDVYVRVYDYSINMSMPYVYRHGHCYACIGNRMNSYEVNKLLKLKTKPKLT